MTDSDAIKALQESEARFRHVIDMAPVLVWMSGTDKSCHYFNKPWLDFTGRSIQQELGNGWIEGVHREDVQRCLETYTTAFDARQEFKMEYRLKRYDGEYHWFLDHGVPHVTPEGNFLGYIGSCVDITDRKQAEAIAQQREAELSLITDAVPVLISFVDAQQRYRFVNKRYEEWFGYPSAEIYGQPIRTVVGEHAYATLRPYIERVLAGEQVSFENTVPFERGGPRAVYATYVPQFDRQGQVEGFIALVNDLSNIRQAENALRESEERLRVAQLATKIGAWDWDIPANRVFWTREYYTLYGLDPSVPSSYENWLATMLEADRANADQTARDALRRRQTHLSVEYRVAHPTEGIRWFSCRGQIFYDAAGHPNRAIGIVIDITDRKLTEATLQENEQRFHDMADNAPMMIWVTDPTGSCTYLNRSWYDFSGQTEAEGLGFGWLNVVHPDDLEISKQIFLTANDRQEAFQLEYRLRRKDGVYRTCIDTARPWFSADGEFKGYIGSVMDIDERIQAEHNLRRSEERYRTLFESIDEGFCVIEVLFDQNDVPIDYRFLEINPVFEQQTGLQHAIGKTVRQLVPDLEDHWIKIYGRVALTGIAMRFESGARAMNRWFDVYACRTGPPEERKVAIVFKDTTDRKRIEVEREHLLQREQAARETAETANRIKDEFLAILSHELRSPLNPILGWTKLLQARKLNEQGVDRALEIIERNARLQTQLIEDLLDISRILRGKLVLHEHPVDLIAIIEAALETVRLAAEVKKIDIQLMLNAEHCTVFGDSARLQQVVWNLLTNAIKFTPQAGRVTVRLSRVGQFAQILVEDNGKGINPDFLPYVFEHFRQEDGATTRKFGGLGLGLAIVRYLTELHGGTAGVFSLGENKGATFTISLPLMEPGHISPEPDHPLSASISKSSSLAGLQVLVVDDDPDTRELVTLVLEAAGATVLSAASAPEALHRLKTAHLDLLISDIGMPEMDGYMLMRQIKRQGGQQPNWAIAVTAYAAEYDQQQAIAAGFQKHLSKPIEPETLVAAIVGLIQNQERSPG